jgi:NADPH:quinone reductase-like Zn-dependent oxidoreductase
MRNMTLPPVFGVPMRLYMGWRKPTRASILGMALAGEVEAVGEGVEQFKPGDQIFASTNFHFGAYAEYTCLPAEGPIAPKPSNMSYVEASALPLGGIEALHFLQGNVLPGEKVLINGAAGSIGCFAVQLAKLYGGEVTAVDSTSKLALLRSLGADHVVDYTQQDFTRDAEAYDVVMDVVGSVPLVRALRAVKPGGRLLIANPGVSHLLRGRLTDRTSGKRVMLATSDPSREEMLALKALAEEGKLRAVVDRCYPLEDAAAAHRYVESGGKLGDVVLKVWAVP